jgi:acyl-CoA hydrolase
LLQEGDVKLKECNSEKGKCRAETDRLKKKLYAIEQENNELKRRLVRIRNFFWDTLIRRLVRIRIVLGGTLSR